MNRITLAVAAAAVTVTAMPAQAKICRTYVRGHYVRCHKAFRPSINLRRKQSVKIIRCRHHGHNVNCKR